MPGRDGADDLAVLDHAQVAVARDAPHHRSADAVALGQGQRLFDLPRLDDGEHAFLGLGDHDLPRLHSRLPPRDLLDLDVDADTPARRHLRGRRGYAGRPEVLQGDEQVLLQKLQAALYEHLLGERVADLHV